MQRFSTPSHFQCFELVVRTFVVPPSDSIFRSRLNSESLMVLPLDRSFSTRLAVAWSSACDNEGNPHPADADQLG